MSLTGHNKRRREAAEKALGLVAKSKDEESLIKEDVGIVESVVSDVNDTEAKLVDEVIEPVESSLELEDTVKTRKKRTRKERAEE